MSHVPAVDQAVLEVLPKGIRILSVDPAGSSEWTTTSSVSVAFADGTLKKYFLKTANGPPGRTMLEGEFAASTAIHAAMPSLIPKAYAWGRYYYPSSETYFILSDYVRIGSDLPDPDKLAERLAELHRTATSSNGMFGFSVPTCDGALPHRVAWKANWGEFFGELLRGVLEHDTAAHGRWDELDQIVDNVINYVIPRLLGALQADGRQLRPSLIHGDLYEANIGTHEETGEVIAWDASSFYAHNEMELGLWRWSKVMHGFTESYLRYFKKSEPQQEWDDRNRLYSVKTKLNMSADHPGDNGKAMRQVAYEDLCYLYDKYGRTEQNAERL